ncbi:MAG: type II toxin-antitoxin system Phd/YefM family antitoxin [Opitutaceae bacterium]|nr:type II toxin-antitoxin system Phd/YefM family antitoxin [Opitutaceae bacterium]
MQTISANGAKQNLGAVIDAARRKPVTITKHGKPAVIVTSAEDYRDLRDLVHDFLKAEVRKGLDDLAAGRSQAFETKADLHLLFKGLKARLNGHKKNTPQAR